jgi:hypothetical protein
MLMRPPASTLSRQLGEPRKLVRLFLRIRHVRNVERLASFRQRDPRIPQACIMFALLGVVCFLRQRCAPVGRFPSGLALGSHRSFPFPLPHPRKRYIATTANLLRAGVSHFSLRKKRSRSRRWHYLAALALKEIAHEPRALQSPRQSPQPRRMTPTAFWCGRDEHLRR